MLEFVITLLVGFALGYVACSKGYTFEWVRDWISTKLNRNS